eukprot:1295603-Prymnesium_polylepis.2
MPPPRVALLHASGDPDCAAFYRAVELCHDAVPHLNVTTENHDGSGIRGPFGAIERAVGEISQSARNKHERIGRYSQRNLCWFHGADRLKGQLELTAGARVRRAAQQPRMRVLQLAPSIGSRPIKSAVGHLETSSLYNDGALHNNSFQSHDGTRRIQRQEGSWHGSPFCSWDARQHCRNRGGATGLQWATHEDFLGAPRVVDAE